MIGVNDIFLSTLDKINEDSNGQLTKERFNRYLWLSQLRGLDWLSGDVSNVVPPTPYTAQKDKDWLSPFITKYTVQVQGGYITKPDNYYLWENAYILGNYSDTIDCESDETVTSENCNVPIELLDGDSFTARCQTYIEGLKPSFTKPIAKEIGNTFEFLPQDIGSITVEYIRYPVRAFLGTKMDTQYNELVYDPATSIDLEWSPFAEDVISWFIADMFFNYVSNQSGKANNVQTGKTVRDTR